MTRRDQNQVVIRARDLRRVAIVIVLVLIVVLAFLQRDRIGGLFGSSAPRYVDPNGYQAVFLVTQQVYFGKLSIDGDTYLLTDVFYVNAQEGQPGGGQLVKRGGELHGPREPMIILAREVLFIENLRDDSQVVQGIQLIKSGKVPPAPSPAATTRPSPSPTR